MIQLDVNVLIYACETRTPWTTRVITIESGCELISMDRDYARIPGLRWRHSFN